MKQYRFEILLQNNKATLTHHPFYHHCLPAFAFLKQARSTQATAPLATQKHMICHNNYPEEMANHVITGKRRTTPNQLQAGILQNNL
ncbi:hypothetical protein [Collimonas antrihumi]|uniref:hypothetical protein n=1 Tax=Collimonas antrihumi TaxID=1940615 RepID=UPI001B8AA5EB|nr:hypothetical protein [Collimonas antrihumi]